MAVNYLNFLSFCIPIFKFKEYDIHWDQMKNTVGAKLLHQAEDYFC